MEVGWVTLPLTALARTQRGVGSGFGESIVGKSGLCSRRRRSRWTAASVARTDNERMSGVNDYGRARVENGSVVDLFSAIKSGNEKEALRQFYVLTEDRTDVKFYNKMLGMFGEKFPSHVAENVYFELEKKDLRPTTLTFSILMKLFAAEGRADKVEEAFSAIKKWGFDPNRSAFNSLILARGKNGNIAGMERAFEELRALKVHPNNVTFNAMLTVFRNKGDVGKLQKYFLLMQRFSLKPDVITYSIVLDALGKKGHLKSARMALRDMKGRGILPNTVTFNTLLKMYANHGEYELLEATRKDMQDSGVSMTRATYTILINAYVQNPGMTERMNELLLNMRRGRTSLDESTYATLLKAYASAGDVKAVEDILAEVKSLHMRPRRDTYNAVIHRFSQCGMTGAAEAVFADMQAAKIAPDTVTYNTMLKLRAGTKNTESIRRTLEEMDSANIRRDHWTRSILIDTFVKTGDVEAAEMELNAVFSNDGKRFDVAVANPLLKHYAVHARIDKLREVLARMEEGGSKPSEWTYNIVLEAMGRSGDIRGAEETLKNMIASGVEPTVVTYTTLMKVYAVGRNIRRIRKCFAKISHPNARTYAVLIHALGRAGDAEGASEAFAEMERVGIPRNVITYTALISALAKAGSVDDAIIALAALKTDDIQPTEVVYTALIHALILERRWTGVTSLVQEAEKAGIQLSTQLLRRVPPQHRSEAT